MKTTLLTLLFFWNMALVFSANGLTSILNIEIRDDYKIENVITIKNGNAYEGKRIHIYKGDEYIDSIYLPSGSTRTFGIGNDSYYQYSFRVDDNKSITIFYSANITIY